MSTETMSTNAITTRRELQAVEDYIARLTDALRRAEGHRDGLLRELQDLQGAHDRRPVAVR